MCNGKMQAGQATTVTMTLTSVPRHLVIMEANVWKESMDLYVTAYPSSLVGSYIKHARCILWLNVILFNELIELSEYLVSITLTESLYRRSSVRAGRVAVPQ